MLSPLHSAQAALTDRAAATAPIHFENLKFDKIAASGVCMALRVNNPTDVDYWLQRYDIKAPAARQTERAAIASGLSQIEGLFGQRFTPAVNTQFNFREGTGNSNQEGAKGADVYTPHVCKHINMNRCKNSNGTNCGDSNVAHMMHELCHQIGNTPTASGRSFYSDFGQKVGYGCKISPHSNSNNNEEYAELCSAFITRPERLMVNARCKKAYDYFANDMFKANGRLASCDPAKQQQMVAAVNSQRGSTQIAALPRPVPHTISPRAEALAGAPRLPTVQSVRKTESIRQIASIPPPEDDSPAVILSRYCNPMLQDPVDDLVSVLRRVSISTR